MLHPHVGNATKLKSSSSSAVLVIICGSEIIRLVIRREENLRGEGRGGECRRGGEGPTCMEINCIPIQPYKIIEFSLIYFY